MEIEVVKELIHAFGEAELTKLSIKCEDFELKLSKEQPQIMPMSTSVASQVVAAPVPVVMDSNQVPTQVSQVAELNSAKKLITAPMVGTFYAATSPKAEPLVKVGSKVKKGDVICVIEAMKLMNEVEAEEDGEIVEILVKNEEMVEYNQPLFVLK